MPRVEKNCPTLYGILADKDPDGLFNMFSGSKDAPDYSFFGYKIPAPNDEVMLECITHEVIKKGLKQANKNLQVYWELFENPPFPAWKDGLKDVWN